MAKYKGINHTALATGDMDSTIRFWRDLLGMKLAAGMGRPGYKQYFFKVADDVFISFFEWPEVEPVTDKDPGRPVKGPFGFDHICFQMNDSDELWSLKRRLEAADVWVTEVIDNGFINSFYSTDPNGIQLEFCCSVEGFDINRNPRMVDSASSDVTLEGPEPQTDKWPEADMTVPQDEKRVYPGELGKLFHGKNRW